MKNFILAFVITFTLTSCVYDGETPTKTQPVETRSIETLPTTTLHPSRLGRELITRENLTDKEREAFDFHFTSEIEASFLCRYACHEDVYGEHKKLGIARWLEAMNSFDVINDNAIKAAGIIYAKYLDEIHIEYTIEHLPSIVRERCGNNGCAEDKIAEHIEQVLKFYPKNLELRRIDTERTYYPPVYSSWALSDTKFDLNQTHHEYNLERLLSTVRAKCEKNGCSKEQTAEHIELIIEFYTETEDKLRYANVTPTYIDISSTSAADAFALTLGEIDSIH